MCQMKQVPCFMHVKRWCVGAWDLPWVQTHWWLIICTELFSLAGSYSGLPPHIRVLQHGSFRGINIKFGFRVYGRLPGLQLRGFGIYFIFLLTGVGGLFGTWHQLIYILWTFWSNLGWGTLESRSGIGSGSGSGCGSGAGFFVSYSRGAFCLVIGIKH